MKRRKSKFWDKVSDQELLSIVTQPMDISNELQSQIKRLGRMIDEVERSFEFKHLVSKEDMKAMIGNLKSIYVSLERASKLHRKA